MCMVGARNKEDNKGDHTTTIILHYSTLQIMINTTLGICIPYSWLQHTNICTGLKLLHTLYVHGRSGDTRQAGVWGWRRRMHSYEMSHSHRIAHHRI